MFYSFQAYADSLGILYLETSAKENTNIEAVFVSLTAEILKYKQVPSLAVSIYNLHVLTLFCIIELCLEIRLYGQEAISALKDLNLRPRPQRPVLSSCSGLARGVCWKVSPLSGFEGHLGAVESLLTFITSRKP